MSDRTIRLFVGVAATAVASQFAMAQVTGLPTTLPSPAQAQQMLQNDPGLVGRLQQMLQSSGMSADQVRQKLRQAGYPDSLLNAYLPGGTRPDSTFVPSADVFEAVRAIGIVDTLAVDSLGAFARGKRRTRDALDSAFLDTLKLALKNDTLEAAVRTLLKSRTMRLATMDSGFKVFGEELFQVKTTQFDANVSVGADPSYRFGAGDKLVLFLTGDVEKSYPLTVNPQGFVFIPDVGIINVAGQTRTQLEDMLYDRLGRVYSGVRRGAGATTRFYIDLGQMGTNQVFVNGDVQHPNSYRISRAGTVLTALYMAGGPTASGSLRRVEVRRNGQLVTTLDVYDYALHGDASQDIRLENGDIVFVPPRGGQVRIAGAVLRPATYELKPGQTLAEVIDMAGGFTSAAERRRIEVTRIVPPAERTTAGSDRRIRDFTEAQLAAAPASGGDIVRVFEVPRRVANRVSVEGNVWTPGLIGYAPGMTLFDALRRAGGLKPDSYLGVVQVTRLLPDSTREMLRSEVTDTVGHPVNNLNLQDGDEITVFSTTEMRPNRYVTVGGAVRKPGIQIPYSEGMTLRDAVLLAGGLTEGALLTEAEIARLPDSREGGVTAVTKKVALDSSYLFERGVGGRYVGPPGVVIASGRATQEFLQPYDAITIKLQPEWQLQQTVAIRGEVMYPADYALVSRTEKLSDLIKRAGGLTPAAYANGVVFIRKRENVGRIGIDLPKVLRDPSSVDNVQLVDGDSVFIPKFNQVVTVRGSVNAQVGVSYVDGANLDFYIRSAGGATSKGDQRRAFVTQPNGKVDTYHRRFLFWVSKPKPLAGSTVMVPVRDPNDKRDWAQIATAAVSILGSLVAISAIVKR